MKLALWQKILFGIVSVSSAGTLIELLLLEHTEEIYQLIPVVLLGITLIMSVVVLALPRAAVINSFRVVMLACLVSAAVGILLHYQGNTEFALERQPKLRGWELFKEAIMGATPALAPGTMAQIALIGLLATFRFRSV